jgi:phage terminase large subunit-like protein
MPCPWWVRPLNPNISARGSCITPTAAFPIAGTTVQTTDTTFANQVHLPQAFITQIVGLYDNTRLGPQEIYAEILETSEAAWFTRCSMRAA